MAEIVEPYQEVIDSLNQEYDTSIQFVATDDEPNPYTRVIIEDVEDFRNETEQYILDMAELQAAEDENGIIDLDAPQNAHLLAEKEVSVQPKAIPYTKTQTAYLSKGGYFSLHSTVNWNPGMNYMVYVSLDRVSGGPQSGNRFRLSSFGRGTTNSSKTALVEARGMHVSASNITDGRTYTYNKSFKASE